jgi:hypothetical protein
LHGKILKLKYKNNRTKGVICMKKNWKRILTILVVILAVFMVLSFSACKKEEAQPSVSVSDEVEDDTEVKEETTPIKENYVKDVEKVVEEVVQEQPSFIDSLMDEEEPAFVETPEVEVVEPQKVCCVKCGKELNENQIAFYQ